MSAGATTVLSNCRPEPRGNGQRNKPEYLHNAARQATTNEQAGDQQQRPAEREEPKMVRAGDQVEHARIAQTVAGVGVGCHS